MPPTYFHSLTKNLTSQRSVSVFSPKAHYMFSSYHKKLHFTTLSFSFSIPRPITCFHSMRKNLTSLRSVSVFQSQGLLHISNGLQTPQFIPTFHSETTHKIYVGEYFQGHVDHYWSDIEYVVHSHCNMHTVDFPWNTQNTFLLSI